MREEKKLESWDDGSSVSWQETGPREEGRPPWALPVGVEAEGGRKGGTDIWLPPSAAPCHLCGSTASEKEAPAVGLLEEEGVLKRMGV